MQHQTLRIVDERPLRQHYEGVAFKTMLMLWRRKWLIALLVLLAVACGLLAAIFLEKKYTADALIQLNLVRQEPGDAAAVAPPVALDAEALMNTEARIIQSRSISHRVVRILSLEFDPDFIPRPGVFNRFADWVKSLMSPEPSGSQPPPLESLIAVDLLRNLSVTNDNRSYLIHISYVSNSPERSALIANAFAGEYVRSRSEGALQKEIDRLSARYGDRHPSVAQARGALSAAADSPPTDDSVKIVMQAEPIPIPSSPNRVLILAASVVGAIGLGVLISILLERRDSGFKTDSEVFAETGIRCLSMVPELGSRAKPHQPLVYAETVRAIGVMAGIVGGTSGQAAVVMITSSLPGEGKSRLSISLAHALSAAGRRCLVLDTSPNHKLYPVETGSAAPTLESSMKGSDHKQPVFDRNRAPGVLVLRRSSGLNESQGAFVSPAFARLIDQAKRSFDAVIIEAPPVNLLSDAIQLRPLADLVIHVARWNHTPRQAVKAALQRFSDMNIRVDGIVLTRVDLKKHKRYHFVDPIYYLGKYSTFFRAKEQAKPVTDKTAGVA